MQFAEDFPGSEMRFLTQIIIGGIFEAIATVDYDSPKTFITMAAGAGTYLLGKGGYIAAMMSTALGAGDSTDAIPVVGWIAQAIAAAGLAASLSETIADVCRSPKTYDYELTMTHNIQVTINHDPKDPLGFPATATQYVLKAIFDEGTSWTANGSVGPRG